MKRTDVSLVWRRAAAAGFDWAGVAGLIVAIAAWQLAAARLGSALPPPRAVIENAIGNLFSSDHLPGIGLPRGGYLPHLLYTAYDVFIGGCLGAAAGIATGLASAENQKVCEILDPLASILGVIPIVVMAPFFLMWFGLSGYAQIALVALYTGTILHLFAYRGARNLSPAFLDYAATLGASRLQRFARVRFPGALPEIFGGLRIGFSAAWGLATVTEMLGGQFGAGRVLTALRSVYDLTGIMALVLLLSVLAMSFDGLIMAARFYALRWASAFSDMEEHS